MMVSMGSVWDRTAEFLSDNLGAILPLSLVLILVPAIIGGNFAELQQGATPGLSLGLGIGSLLLALVSFWGQLAITALALDPALGKGAAASAARRYPAALLVMVVMLASALVLAIPVAVILAANGVDLTSMAPGSTPDIPAAAGGALALYILILLPVLLWLMSRLAVTLSVVVDERMAIGALARSWRLTRGLALKIIGVMLLYVIVSLVANLATTSAFGAIMFLVAGRDEGLSLASVLTSVVGGAVSTAFTVLGTAFTAKLYLALRAREASVRA